MWLDSLQAHSSEVSSFLLQGRTLETIEELFNQPWSKRANVTYYLCCCCLIETCASKTEGHEDEWPLGVSTETSSSTKSDTSSIGKQKVDREIELQDIDRDLRHEPSTVTEL